jgi:hypothetical protein
MKWRPLLAVVLGVLVPLPLAWLLVLSMKATLEISPTPEATNIVPMLTGEERHRLLTYERDCQTNADCESPLICFYNELIEKRYCTDSKCMTDMQCSEAFACRTLVAENGEDRMRGCSLVGIRKEGESCERLPYEREVGCERDLRCQSRCGRPCELDEPTSCPVGFVCEDGPDGPSCLPRCDGLTCPEGHRCVGVGKGISICARIHGPDCELNPCPEGQECKVHTDLAPADEVWMECVSPCADSEPHCPEGTACYSSRCHTSCGHKPSICPSNFRCGRMRPIQPWVCLPRPLVNAYP